MGRTISRTACSSMYASEESIDAGFRGANVFEAKTVVVACCMSPTRASRVCACLSRPSMREMATKSRSRETEYWTLMPARQPSIREMATKSRGQETESWTLMQARQMRFFSCIWFEPSPPGPRCRGRRESMHRFSLMKIASS